MGNTALVISTAQPQELAEVGALMARAYSQLDGFPSREEQPAYYEQFDQLGKLTATHGTTVLIARTQGGDLIGSVVYFANLKHYGAGGEAITSITNASAIRLLAVSPAARGTGAGRTLTEACVARARQAGHSRMVLHTTRFMQTAWGLYERMGFVRSPDLDFKQGELDVLGFQLTLSPGE
jgi:GNAT superfamily N-acetyltransferase